MNTSITIMEAGARHRESIIRLLQAEKLPVDDLPPDLPHFYIAIIQDQVIGAVGLERYGNSGLLRSLVVDARYRNLGIADTLLHELQQRARQLGIDSIYLLTETAPGYFSRKGFSTVSREEVPESLKASSEFSHVCPVSAAVMKKQTP